MTQGELPPFSGPPLFFFVPRRTWARRLLRSRARRSQGVWAMGQGATLRCSGLFRERHLSPLCSLPSRSTGFLARPGSPRAWPGTGGPEVEPASPSAEGRRRAQASPLHPQTTPPGEGCCLRCFQRSCPTCPGDSPSHVLRSQGELRMSCVTPGQRAVKPKPSRWAADLHRASQA